MPKILHVGCGREPLPDWLQGLEVRLDIDPTVSPDIIAPLTALGDVGQFQLVYNAHVLEHLPAHEVPVALAEFWRVLYPGGAVICVVPDLEGVQPTLDVVYVSPAGPITGLDMYYGKTDFVARNPYMAHKTGFTLETLKAAIVAAGFRIVRAESFNHNAFVIGQK